MTAVHTLLTLSALIRTHAVRHSTRLNGLFDQIQPSPPSIYLAISAEDSSIVYYKIANGIVPPKEIKD